MATESPTKLSLYLSFLLAAITYFQPDEYSAESMPKNVPVENLLKSYHFIIIGGGSAGSVLANRLTEISHWNVLLIEAGDNENTLSDVPMLIGQNPFDWSYKIEPQKHGFFGFNNRQTKYLRGKCLGGSSTVNGLVYLRGDLKCFDEWEAQGNTGWGSKEALKYFIKLENNTIPYLADSPLRGRDGPLSVSEITMKSPPGAAFIEGAQELGYKIKDLNGEGGEGFMNVQLTTTRGGAERCSASKAYLKPIRNRSNLHITMNSTVTKILIHDDSKKAYAVRFIRDGVEYVIKAENEVILSAGSTNSPQILMLSGIGPATDLKKFNIPVYADLPPVGKSLRDHVSFFGMPLTISAPGRYDASILYVQDIIDYAENRNGQLSVATLESVALIKSKYAKTDIPDIQLSHSPGNSKFNKANSLRSGVNEEFYNAVYGNLNDSRVIDIFPIVVQPYSTGYIALKSANPFEAPLINPNYFSDPRDLDVLVEAVKVVIDLTETKAFKKIGVKYLDFDFPGCEKFAKRSDEYWRCAIVQYPGPYFHAASSCKMGINDDAVVNPRLLVNGVSGLRVIDASIMPTLTNANTNGAVIMIGEKGADLIKEDWDQYFE